MESLLFLLNLQEGLPGQSNVEDSLNRVLVNVENVREFEDKSAGLVLFEAKAASEEVEARDGEGLVGQGEDEFLELKDLAGLLLDLHVVVVAMVTYALELFGDGGGLGHGPGGRQV